MPCKRLKRNFAIRLLANEREHESDSIPARWTIIGLGTIGACIKSRFGNSLWIDAGRVEGNPAGYFNQNKEFSGQDYQSQV